jgi:hypothetical protein
MSAIRVFEQVGDQPGLASPLEVRSAARSLSSNTYVLRKSGSRPVSFNGRHVGQHSGYRVGTPLWHELNLYQTDDGRFVTDIRVYSKAAGSKDQFHVNVVESLEEALQLFEGYDARTDVTADFDLDGEMAPAELMVQAAALRYRIADAVSQYRAVLGSFLQSLNNG